MRTVDYVTVISGKTITVETEGAKEKGLLTKYISVAQKNMAEKERIYDVN